ncbi:hypothetical protein [Ruminococcus sp.]|uniref:hypothetical protein n=1 Tax=Ruminococcus sp. TaxID=41978 RepID=UPI0025EAC5F1|nr:hypothetical protein [Ruminococcus sp.]
MNTLSDKKKLIPILISSAVCILMVAVAEMTGEKEIIFPEIAAIAIGTLAAPTQSWNASKLRMITTLTIAALMGMAVVRFVPFPQYIQIPIALTASMALITLSRTNFLPAISACLLPILLVTRSFLYPVSVVVTTSLILLAQHILEETGLRGKHIFIPIKPDKALLKLRIAQVIISSLICFLPTANGRPFLVAPPLLVAFAEMTAPNSRIKKNMRTATIMMALCAFLGCSSRLLLTEILGLPLALAAAITCCAVMFAVDRTAFYFPPCGAIAVLPFVIPLNSLLIFPFAVTLGFLAFATLTMLTSDHVIKEQTETAHEEQEHAEALNHI